ncbi:MAG: oligosaccharide flippase family protein [Gammaproteobacteria bacterium]
MTRASETAKRYLRRGSLGRNVATMFSGSVAAQILGVAILPLLTRVYTPADFGIFAVFYALSAVLATGISARYEMAVVLPRGDAGARYVLLLSILLAIGLSSIALALAFVAVPFVQASERYGALAHTLYLLPLSLLAVGITRTASSWLTRTKRFHALIAIRFQQVLLVIAFQLVFAIADLQQGFGLIFGLVAGQLATMCYCLLQMQRDRLFRLPGMRRLVIAAKDHRQMPAFSLPSGLLNSFSQQSLSLVLAFFFAPPVIGAISLAQRALKTPLNTITLSISRVYSQRLAENVAHGRSNVPVVVKTVRFLMLIGAVGSVPIVLWAEPLFDFVFGSAWREAGRYVVWLLPIAITQLAIRGVSRMFIYRKNHIGLIWQIFFLAGTLTAIMLGGVAESVKIALVAYSLFGSGMYILHLALTLRYAGGSILSLFRP